MQIDVCQANALDFEGKKLYSGVPCERKGQQKGCCTSESGKLTSSYKTAYAC